LFNHYYIEYTKNIFLDFSCIHQQNIPMIDNENILNIQFYIWIKKLKFYSNLFHIVNQPILIYIDNKRNEMIQYHFVDKFRHLNNVLVNKYSKNLFTKSISNQLNRIIYFTLFFTVFSISSYTTKTFGLI
jgi:hypothetical protein